MMRTSVHAMMTACVALAIPLIAALPGRSPAATTRSASPVDPVVSAPWLAAHLHDRGVVVLQVSRRPDYENGHIDGARFVEPGSLDGTGTGMSMDMSVMPSEAELHGQLEKLGISDDSRVVVAFSGTAITVATRVLFMLGYAGLEHTALLDGGMDAWKRGKFPVTRSVTAPVTGHLATHVVPALAVDFAFVQSHINAPHVRIVDARTPNYYGGAAQSGMSMSAGHIPGAASLPFNTLFDGVGLLVDAKTMAARFRAAGVQPGDTVIAYCHVGMQATVVVLGARLIGNPVRMYAGSFHDWSARKLPTEGGT